MAAQTNYRETVMDGIGYDFNLGRKLFGTTLEILGRRSPGDINVIYSLGPCTSASSDEIAPFMPSFEGARRSVALTQMFQLTYSGGGRRHTERIAKFDTLLNGKHIEDILIAGNCRAGNHMANQMALRLDRILGRMHQGERLWLGNTAGKGDYMDSELLRIFRTEEMPGRVAFLYDAPKAEQ